MGADDHVEAPRRVHDASAAAYVDFAGTELGGATEEAADLSMLDAFAGLVRSVGATGPVADVGCGPGRAAAFLARHQLRVVGVDLSMELLTLARRAHPDLPVAQGRLDQLPFGGGSLRGAVCWYSIIYTPPPLLEPVLAELARVTIPGGVVLLAFQAGSGEALPREDAFDTGLTLTAYRHDVDDLVTRLDPAGFDLHSSSVRPPSLPHETTRQAVVIAVRRRSYVT